MTKKNCYKCDLETIIDNNSQYFWTNLRDFEVETENKWLNIFNKHGNKSTLKYRRELTPNIKFQAGRIFVRNDLFEQVIKSCKAANIEFLMFKEKLGICSYEENCYEEEIIKIQDEESIEKIVKVSTKKSTKKLTKELIKESDNETINESDNKSDNESDNESIKESDNESIKEIDKESKEKSIKDFKETTGFNNKNTTNWYDKSKFSKILTTIDNNDFNHTSKIVKLKFNDINELINNIKNNTISKADTKKKINELNEIKKAEIKGKPLIKNQEKLLSLFDDLKTIFNNNNNSNNNESDSNNNNENENKNVNENVNENEHENESDNENEKDECYYEIRQLNNWFKTIDQTKSLEEQIELLKKRGEFLSEYWSVKYYHDNKELNRKIFKAKAAYVLNDVDDNLFEKIFGCKFATLVDKLINTTSKEENQMLINDIKKNKDKILEEYKFNKSVIKQRGDLYDVVKVILEFNERIQSDLT